MSTWLKAIGPLQIYLKCLGFKYIAPHFTLIFLLVSMFCDNRKYFKVLLWVAFEIWCFIILLNIHFMFVLVLLRNLVLTIFFLTYPLRFEES
jgi:hypothetical protein